MSENVLYVQKIKHSNQKYYLITLNQFNCFSLQHESYFQVLDQVELEM